MVYGLAAILENIGGMKSFSYPDILLDYYILGSWKGNKSEDALYFVNTLNKLILSLSA